MATTRKRTYPTPAVETYEPPVAPEFAIGEPVQFKRNGRLMLAKVKSILPTGALELSTSQYGIQFRRASEVKKLSKKRRETLK